jgi:hypothetical protein
MLPHRQGCGSCTTIAATKVRHSIRASCSRSDYLNAPLNISPMVCWGEHVTNLELIRRSNLCALPSATRYHVRDHAHSNPQRLSGERGKESDHRRPDLWMQYVLIITVMLCAANTSSRAYQESPRIRPSASDRWLHSPDPIAPQRQQRQWAYSQEWQWDEYNEQDHVSLFTMSVGERKRRSTQEGTCIL